MGSPMLNAHQTGYFYTSNAWLYIFKRMALIRNCSYLREKWPEQCYWVVKSRIVAWVHTYLGFLTAEYSGAGTVMPKIKACINFNVYHFVFL